jgi:hypothetical protein
MPMTLICRSLLLMVLSLIATFLPTDARSATSACPQGVLCVGPGKQFKSLAAANAAAHDGSIIELAGGTYRETIAVSAKGITIRSAPNVRAVVDCSGMRPAWGKACILVVGGDTTIADLDIRGAKGSDHNEACLRNEPNTRVTARGIRCTDSYNGILGSGGSWMIEDSEFYGVGNNDGYTHGVYLAGTDASPCSSAILRGVFIHDVLGGHTFKSRCAENVIQDSRFEENGQADSIDFSEGGMVLIERSILHQPNGENGNILRHGSESCTHKGDVAIRDSQIINERTPAYIYSRCGRITFENTPVPSTVQVKSP